MSLTLVLLRRRGLLKLEYHFQILNSQMKSEGVTTPMKTLEAEKNFSFEIYLIKYFW